MAYSPQSRKESDTTERFHFTSLQEEKTPLEPLQTPLKCLVGTRGKWFVFLILWKILFGLEIYVVLKTCKYLYSVQVNGEFVHVIVARTHALAIVI